MADGPVRIRPSDLVVEGGTAGNAADLIDAVYASNPPELQKALLLRHHALIHQEDNVETPELDYGKVAKAAGLDEIESAAIRGSNLDDAYVVYVARDHLGANYKGAFKYSELGGSGVDSHVSQAEAFDQSPKAEQLRKARETAAQEDEKLVTTTRKPRGKQPSGDEGDDK